jgi:muramoyltetrapeptide carboxypeptidase
VLEHLKQSGALKGCLGMIFGDFLFGDERDGANFVQYALDRFAAENLIPCFSGLQMGHGENNRMIAMGPMARLEKNILHIPAGLSLPKAATKKARR